MLAEWQTVHLVCEALAAGVGVSWSCGIHSKKARDKNVSSQLTFSSLCTTHSHGMVLAAGSTSINHHRHLHMHLQRLVSHLSLGPVRWWHSPPHLSTLQVQPCPCQWFIFLCSWVKQHCVYELYFCYPLIYRRTSRLVPYACYCEWWGNKIDVQVSPSLQQNIESLGYMPGVG